jgi:hypothetical protein
LKDKIKDENYFLTPLKENKLIGFADLDSFLEVTDIDDNNKYSLRYNLGEDEKFICNLDFERMSYFIKCFIDGEIQNVNEFQFDKTKNKKRGFYGWIVMIAGLLLMPAVLLMEKLNLYADWMHHAPFISMILIGSGYLSACILNKEIYLRRPLEIKYKDSPEIFVIVFTILSIFFLLFVIFSLKRMFF